MTHSIRSIVDDLRLNGRIVVVRDLVSPASELRSVADRIASETRKLPLFENVEGAPGWKVFGDGTISRDLWARALSISSDNLLREIVARMRAEDGQVIVVDRAAAPILEMSDRFTAHALPISIRGGADCGPIASAILVVPQAERTRLWLVDVLFESGGVSIVDPPSSCVLPGNEMRRCALVFGGEFAAYVAAELGRSEPVDYTLVAKISGAPLRLVDVDGVLVPADAECCLAGALESNRFEVGPISNEVGTYSRQSAISFQHACIHRRRKPILPLIDRGLGPVLLATELQVWRHIENIEGGLDLLDVCCDASAHGLVAAVKLRPRLMGQAKTALLGAISGSATRLKCAVAVDEDIDATRLLDVLWSVASRTHAGRDLDILDGLAMVASDPSAERRDRGAIVAKWLIDTTMPPMSQPVARLDYQRAIPKNLDKVRLAEFDEISPAAKSADGVGLLGRADVH